MGCAPSNPAYGDAHAEADQRASTSTGDASTKRDSVSRSSSSTTSSTSVSTKTDQRASSTSVSTKTDQRAKDEETRRASEATKKEKQKEEQARLEKLKEEEKKKREEEKRRKDEEDQKREEERKKKEEEERKKREEEEKKKAEERERKRKEDEFNSNIKVISPTWTQLWTTNGMTQIVTPMGLWQADAPPGWCPVGSFITYGASYDVSPIKKIVIVNADNATLFPKPKDYISVWDDKKTNGFKSSLAKPVAIWLPVPPSDDFVAVGCIARGDFEKPSLHATRCVHKQFLREGKLGTDDFRKVWADDGSRCKLDASIFLSRNNLFLTVGKRVEDPAPEIVWIFKDFDKIRF